MRSIALVLTLLVTPQPAARKPAVFTTPLTRAEMAGKQAVIETPLGPIVLDLLPEAAPNHVGYFIKLAREGAFNGTTFHRAVARGIIQGGDPLSKNPAARDRYGTGGLNVLKAEPSAEKHTRGAVSAVLLPGRRDSAGSQFFICVVDQPALDGGYDVFARVVEGMPVVERISEAAADAAGRVHERIEIRSVTIRDKPPETPDPFATATPEELAQYRAVLETTAGAITIAFDPAKAPRHVRNFLRLAAAGVYDTTSFHRVVRGFVVQGGMVSTRTAPLTERQKTLVPAGLAPEFNDVLHVKGIVSMARTSDPSSASTSFFICTAPAPTLDGQYTAFGRVVDGLPVVEAIEAAPVQGQEPVQRIELTRVRVERAP